jgi:L-alanine-DL-glutamate epimerase-like enolase superfamily enzyme
MHLAIETFTVHKRFPLTISRGTTSQTTNICLRIGEEGLEGYGEASPFSVVGREVFRQQQQNTEQIREQLQEIIPALERFHPAQRQLIAETVRQAEICSSAQAAIDMALYDWWGKKVGQPLWRCWGLDRSRIVPTSVTVGISSAEAAQRRVRQWQQLTEVKVIKVKLGSPEGIEADQIRLLAVKEVAPQVQLTVDANGGWNLADALKMCHWLAEQGIQYVEQPLAVGAEEDLSVLSTQSPLPIFVDESCFTSKDVVSLANWVNGVNLKIMKTGGLTEAMRTIHTAQACGLQVMLGCYSDSILANTAMAHLSPLADYLDLDSHLNLRDDPFTGATMEAGRLLPNDLPGLGVKYHGSNS